MARAMSGKPLCLCSPPYLASIVPALKDDDYTKKIAVLLLLFLLTSEYQVGTCPSMDRCGRELAHDTRELTSNDFKTALLTENRIIGASGAYTHDETGCGVLAFSEAAENHKRPTTKGER